MRVTLEHKSLQKALGHVVGAVERRNTIPILSCVLVRAQGDTVTLTASDMEIEARAETAATVDQDGAICVEAALLAEIVRKAAAPEVTLRVDKNRVYVKTGTANYQIAALPTEDFPAMPDNLGAGFAFASADLGDLIVRTRAAISADEARYYLNGILLQSRDAKLRAVATDGHKMAMAEQGRDVPAFTPVIVPRKTVYMLQKLLEEAPETIRIALSGTRVRFDIGATRLLSKLIDGTFPDYERVIPTAHTGTAKIKTKDMLDAVERLLCVADGKSRGIRFDFGATDALKISARNSDGGEGEETVPVDYQGEAITTGFNGRYVLEMLEGLNEVALNLNGDGAPALFHDTARPDTRIVIMPMRV